jgi:hypothetical protein
MSFGDLYNQKLIDKIHDLFDVEGQSSRHAFIRLENLSPDSYGIILKLDKDKFCVIYSSDFVEGEDIRKTVESWFPCKFIKLIAPKKRIKNDNTGFEMLSCPAYEGGPKCYKYAVADPLWQGNYVVMCVVQPTQNNYSYWAFKTGTKGIKIYKDE